LKTNYVIPKSALRLMPDVVCNIPGSIECLYLTFDDGPIPGSTEKILNVLKQYNVPASFFCTGKQVEVHPEIYRQIITQGHTTGNHSYSHTRLNVLHKKAFISEIEKTATLVDSVLFRPPYGYITPAMSRIIALHYRIVLWDVMPGDFNSNTDAKTLFRNVKQHASNGSIIVLHDSAPNIENMLDCMKRVIEYYMRQGWQFLKVPSTF